jgi:hypothetical protein
MAPDEPDRDDDAPPGAAAGANPTGSDGTDGTERTGGSERTDATDGTDGGERTDATDGARPPSELRAKDLVGRSREELEAELDPATMAELASWFARPSGVEVRAREVPAEVRAGSATGVELDEFERIGAAMGMLDEDQSAQRAAALAAIEPRMMALLVRHERAADAIVPARVAIKEIVDETIVPASVRAMLVGEGEEPPSIGEPRQVEIPRDIEALLERDNAPQAVLRDLNRPVEEFELRMEPAFPPPPADEDMTHALRDALRWRPEPLPEREPLPDLRQEWRSIHRQPWPELVAAAKEVRQAELAAADAQMQADAEAGIVWRF